MGRTHSLKFKIIVTTLLCTFLVSLAGNLFLSQYLTGIIRQKAERIDQMYLSTIRNQLEDYLSDFQDLAVLCANDLAVSMALAKNDTSSMRQALNAQARLNAYLEACPEGEYVDKLIAFSTEGHVIEASTRLTGVVGDRPAILGSPLYAQVTAPDFTAPYAAGLASSIKEGKGEAFALLCPVRGLGSTPGRGFIYLELGLDLFEKVIAPYAEVNDIFLAADGRLATTAPAGFPADFTAQDLGDVYEADGRLYDVSSTELSIGGLTLYSAVYRTAFDQDSTQVLYVVAVVLLLSLLLAVVLAVMVSAWLTRPISRLDDRLRRIAANDFSFDPAIERSRDELGQIGRTVNEMSVSIDHLLKETQEMYDRRREIELSLLQSQVNPHFLYNTLDSIRWMAVIQKNPGIEQMTRSLSKLLKNIAKGTQDKITLKEELALLDDYVAIQNVRYLETFTFVNRVPEALYGYRIVKLTLQPLVENAIFHGIEPTGECGTITLDGRTEEGDVLLTVTDDGAGIEPDKLAALLTTQAQRGRASLNGIGIANVHQRLQLLYGARYGLTVESELGSFTRVTVRIPKEE